MLKEVFISHSTKDAEIAKRICFAFENKNISCCIAPRDIPYGADWAGEIAKAIKAAKLFVLILSENSNQSDECLKELNVANTHHIPKLCIKIDKSVWNENYEYHLSIIQIITLDNDNFDRMIGEIISCVKSKLHPLNVSSRGIEIGDNLDNILSAKFKDIFSKMNEYMQEDKSSEALAIKLKKAKEKQATDVFFNENENKSDLSLTKLEKKSLIPRKQQRNPQGKYFSIQDPPNHHTLVYQVNQCADPIINGLYYDVTELDVTEEWSSNERTKRTFFLKDYDEMFQPIVLLTFAGEYVLVNMGGLFRDKVIVSQKPNRIRSGVIKQSEPAYMKEQSCYEQSGVKDISINGKKELIYEAKLDSNIVIVDPETCKPIRRKVYYDEKTNSVKASVSIWAGKSYFAFSIASHNYAQGFCPFSDLEIGLNYSEGRYDYPRDTEKALEFFENDGSARSKYEISRIFADACDYDTEQLYLKQASEEGCVQAKIKLALYGIRDGRDKQETEELLKQAAEAGLKEHVKFKEAVFLLAAFAEVGYYPWYSDEEITRMYHNVTFEYQPAWYRTSNYEISGSFEITEEGALNYIRETRDADDGTAEFCLGGALLYGWNIDPQEELGLRYLWISANKGNRDAINDLYEYYLIHRLDDSKLFELAKALIDNAEDLDTAAQIADDFDKIQYASPEIKEIAAIAHAKAKELSGSEEV